jgi:single-stranded-DNA-specific exonuclease
VVKLDANNRRWWRRGSSASAPAPCPAASRACSPRRPQAAAATTFDFGFALGPRINAAGRLADMTLGIECLLTDDPAARATNWRARWTASTASGARSRRHARAGAGLAESLFDEGEEPPPAICVFDPDFHEGVVGIVASRIKDSCTARPSSSRPARRRARARAEGLGPLDPGLPPARCAGPGGQAPSRRAAALRRPRHGGRLHRGRGALRRLRAGARQVAQEWLDAPTLLRRLHTDGPLAPEYRRPDLVDTLHGEVWGQGFAPPVFSEEVEVVFADAGRREAPVAQAAPPGPAGRRDLVRPHPAAAGAGELAFRLERTSGRARAGCASWSKAPKCRFTARWWGSSPVEHDAARSLPLAARKPR